MAARASGSRKSADEPILKIEQLQDVLQELPDFTEWEKLGLNLGLHQGKLNVIEEDCRRNANRLSKVIQEWLRRNHDEKKYGRPTWSNLVKAIKPIENALALKIEKKHCAVRDDEEEDESESEDDDESKIPKPKTLPKKRAKGSSGKTSKKQKVDSSKRRAQPPSKASRKKASSKNGPNAESDGPGSPSGLDREPTNDELEKFVATKVGSPDSLGTMLQLEGVDIDMIKGEEKRTVIMNKRILALWMENETRNPITWRTLVEALRDMKMNRLARQLEEKFGQ